MTEDEIVAAIMALRAVNRMESLPLFIVWLDRQPPEVVMAFASDKTFLSRERMMLGRMVALTWGSVPPPMARPGNGWPAGVPWPNNALRDKLDAILNALDEDEVPKWCRNFRKGLGANDANRL